MAGEGERGCAQVEHLRGLVVEELVLRVELRGKNGELSHKSCARTKRYTVTRECEKPTARAPWVRPRCATGNAVASFNIF